jgi:ABC-2 type transport system permease protein
VRSRNVRVGGNNLKNIRQYQFLFEELVKRDFKKKYKRTILGMGWSMLMPLLTLLVMKIVFEQFFGRNIEHFTTYLFCGNILFCWFSEATNHGMRSLYGNAAIFTKVNVPKYLFLFAGSVQTLINFTLTLIVFFLFCWLDNIVFTWKILILIYPVVTMFFFNVGVGLILSALFIFFRDMDYLWGVFLQLLMYGSAIFYKIDNFSPDLQIVFACNPVYRHIAYFREVVLGGTVPSWETHLVLVGFAFGAFIVGMFMYKRYNTRFLYYV